MCVSLRDQFNFDEVIVFFGFVCFFPIRIRFVEELYVKGINVMGTVFIYGSIYVLCNQNGGIPIPSAYVLNS